jgi:hypothetical protein
MGFNTPLLLLNDRLDDIRNAPERFVESVAQAILRGHHEDHAFGQTTVLKTEHADVNRLLMAGGNTMHELSPYSQRTLYRARDSKSFRESLRRDIDFARRELRDLSALLDRIDEEADD